MKRLATALFFSFILILLNFPGAAAGGYKPLPQGTIVKYDTWSYKVLSSSDDGEEIENSINGEIFKQHSGVLLEGYNGFFKDFRVSIDAVNRKKLRSLFPLKVGKTIKVNYNFDFVTTTSTYAITGVQTVKTPAGAVETYIIKEKSTQDLGQESGFVKQEKTLWFAPSLGVVVMASLSEELIGIDSEFAFIEMPDIFLPKNYKLLEISRP